MRITEQERQQYGAPRFSDFAGIGNDRVRDYVDRHLPLRQQQSSTTTLWNSTYFAGLIGSDEARELRDFDRAIGAQS
jgi:hypothetical protein